MASIDWISIKNEYINTNISQRDLAKKFSVSVSTLTKRANKEKWQQEKETQGNKIATRVKQKTTDAIVKKEVNKIERIHSISDLLLDKLEQAASQLENYIVTNKVKVKMVEYDNNVKGKPKKETITETENIAIVDGIIDKVGLKQLTGALRDLKEIQTTLQAVDKQEVARDPLTESLQELAEELTDD